MGLVRGAMRRAAHMVTVYTATCLWLTAPSPADAVCYTQQRVPDAQHIVLAIDRSGSMRGAALNCAKAGAKAFVSRMRVGDAAAVVAFDSKVSVAQLFTTDRALLAQAIDSIQPGGSTALYDAIARATLMLAQTSSRRTLVYLTDARDVSSQYSLRDIEQMNVCEGVLVHGIGLGDVDTQSLSGLSQATGGSFERTDSPDDFDSLYVRILDGRSQDAESFRLGGIVVRSIPSGAKVFIGGHEAGRTPAKVTGVAAGSHDVMVLFENGAWECDAEIRDGHLTTVRARESDLGADVVIVSKPAGAAVFLDDAYAGVTSYGTPISMRQSDWAERARNNAQQLMVRRVSYGDHQLRVRGIPDFDFGPDQETSVSFTVRNAITVLYVDILRGLVYDETGRVVGRGAPRDPFSQLGGPR